MQRSSTMLSSLSSVLRRQLPINNVGGNNIIPTTSQSSPKRQSSSQKFTNPLKSTSTAPTTNTSTASVQFDSSVAQRVEADIKKMFREIHQELDDGIYDDTELKEMSKYYFDGQGKAVRPFISMTLGHAINIHLNRDNEANTLKEMEDKQRKIAIISEMIHTASLVHDDILDHAETRRSKESVNRKWNGKKSTMCGDYILATSSKIMAQLRSEEVVIVMSKILTDLVHGEFQQLQNKNNENERFTLYLSKTFNKTASLIAYSCQANAIIAGASSDLIEASYQYGRSIGIAFQLVDDLLDFVSTSDLLGKPAAADLQLGLATAPVLFATKKYPELDDMIARRFSNPGDVESAYRKVLDSDGLERTRELARNYCSEAVKAIEPFSESPYKSVLISMTDKVLNRLK